MRKLLTALVAAALVVALAAPALADNSSKPSDRPITAMRAHGDDWHGGWRHADRDDWGYRHHGYYRHHYGYYGYPYYSYGYPYYYDGYYYNRCRWAYYHDPYYFDRYCRYYYGYY